MTGEILEKLQQITPEEQRILSGEKTIEKEIYMEENSNVIDATKLLEAGKLIQVRTHTRFIHFPEHTHNYVEMIYMCSGSTHHILNQSNDGFKIASEDLKLRGPGDFFGIRQSGEMQFALADIYQDAYIMQRASEEVADILGKDPELSSEDHKNLKDYLELFLADQRNKLNL